MLILRNATAVQFEPARVDEGVDIAIDGTAIVTVGKKPDGALSGCDSERDAGATGDAGHCLCP